MRTTLTLEADLAKALKEYAHRHRTTFKQAVDELLRRGLSAQREAPPRPPFVVVPHEGGFQTGVDPVRLKQQLSEEDDQAFLRKAGR